MHCETTDKLLNHFRHIKKMTVRRTAIPNTKIMKNRLTKEAQQQTCCDC